MRETARLTSSLLGYRLTDAKRRYCRRGVSSGPTLMWGIWTKKEPLLLPCCPLPPSSLASQGPTPALPDARLTSFSPQIWLTVEADAGLEEGPRTDTTPLGRI